MTAARRPYYPTHITPAMRSALARGTRPDPWLLVEEIADQLRLSKMTVYRAIHAGDLKAARVGRSFRVRTSDYQRWVSGEEWVLAEESDL